MCVSVAALQRRTDRLGGAIFCELLTHSLYSSAAHSGAAALENIYLEVFIDALSRGGWDPLEGGYGLTYNSTSCGRRSSTLPTAVLLRDIRISVAEKVLLSVQA